PDHAGVPGPGAAGAGRGVVPPGGRVLVRGPGGAGLPGLRPLRGARARAGGPGSGRPPPPLPPPRPRPPGRAPPRRPPVAGVPAREAFWRRPGGPAARQKPLRYHAGQLPRGVTWYADPSGASEIAELRCAGFAVRRGDNALRPGIAAVSARLGDGSLRVVEG